ncbi:MAG TPA: c-type cytochrome [Acidobacteriaceae bacterium]|jgi:mono/diheme cytochrome c family protein|nr:c-type cytochrome [Acidobacteriaceae bacterium]
MRVRTLASIALLPFALALGGCTQMPGYPKAGPPIPPDKITDFHTLFSQNCQACHGAGGQNGPAMDLANPEFQALVDDNTLRNIIANGLPGTQMPAWARSAGGMLTDQQINAIIAGMRREWAKPNAFAGATPPPYLQSAAGDANTGKQMYQARCASCHGGVQRQQIDGSVYLSLVSDQALRSIIIAGRPDIGQPDWQHDNPRGAQGQPLSEKNVNDIVTYLHSLRNPADVSAAPHLAQEVKPWSK